MKNLLALFIAFLVGAGVYAQEPQWIDADYRANNYPTSTYLVGYSEIFDVSKKQADESMDRLKDLSKSILVQSVRVVVKSVSTSNVSDFNGEISDYFNQKTTSESDLQLVGLQTESYYDKKNKKAYAFSYVRKSKMSEYYRSEIGKNITDITYIIDQGEELLKSGNIKSAYETGLKAYNMFYTIGESQKVLMAIGSNSELDTRVSDVNTLNTDFKKFMNSVVTDRRMSVDDMGFIISKGLDKTQGDNHKGTTLEDFTYEQTGFTSDLSYKLSESIRQTLPDEKGTAAYAIRGSFFQKDDRIVVKSTLLDIKNNQVIGSNKVEIPEANLIAKEVKVIPKDIERLEMLPTITMVSKTKGASGKAGMGLDRDLVVYVTKDGNPVGGVPISFSNSNNGVVYCVAETDENGEAHCRVKKIGGEYKNQMILAQVDMSTFLDNDSSDYVKGYLANKSVPSASFKVVVNPSTIFVQAQENNFGQSLDVKLIEPQIKESLSDKGFDFKGYDDGVDYVIKIKASSRKGGSFSGVYFAYVDVTISVYDNNLGKEIYKESINNIKGGGGTFDQAGGKAYYEAANQARDKVVSILVQQ